MKKVLLAKEFGNNIFTRSSISEFFKKLKKLKNSEILIDFKNVEFISRSCADEYIKQKNAIKKKLVEVNMSKNVYSMFDTVRKQYEKRNASFTFEIVSEKKKSHILIN